MTLQPNLFILGAPKCGTTSLASWLARHPDVFVPRVKEPHHYNSDEKQVYYPGREEYLALFEGGENAKYRLDASVWYLHSDVAVPRILTDCPQARFIVCLRNPVDMAFSLHAQYLNKTGRENVKSFAKAWHISDQRKNGKRVPLLASEPTYLAYKYSCRIGSQSKRLLGRVPRNRVVFVVLDDLIYFPEATLSGLLQNLDLEESIPFKLPEENPSMGMKFPALNRLRIFLSKAAGVNKRAFFSDSVRRYLRKILTDEGRPKIDSETRKEVTRYLLTEIELVWEVTGSRYEHWVDCLRE